MTIMGTVRVALRGTGVPVAQAPGMNGQAHEIISRGGLTPLPDLGATIAAEPPSRRAAEPPHPRPGFGHERAGMGPLPPVRLSI